MPLIEIWRAILGEPTVETSTTFWECGATSMDLMQLLAEVNSRTSREWTYDEIVEAGSLAAIANALDESA